MFKAHSRRHVNKVVVIGSTVFRFDAEGNTAVANNGHNQPDFDALLRMPGVVDKRELSKAELKAAEKKTKFTQADITAAKIERLVVKDNTVNGVALTNIDMALSDLGVVLTERQNMILADMKVPAPEGFDEMSEAQKADVFAAVEAEADAALALQDAAIKAAKEETVEQETTDSVQPEVRLETKPEGPEVGEVAPVGPSKKKGRPKKKSEEAKE